MAEKTRLFPDHRSVGPIMSSPSPRTRKRLGRGVRNFDSGVGDMEKRNAVLSATYAKFTQNPVTKKHFRALTTRFLPNLALWNQCGASTSGRMVPRPITHAGKRKTLLGDELFNVLEAIRDNETGSAHPASRCRFRTCTANARTKKSRSRRGRAVNSGQRSQSFSFGVSDLFSWRVDQLKAVEFWR